MKEFITEQKIYDMILYGHQALSRFPKAEKYALAQDIKQTMYGMYDTCTALNKKYYKKTTLQELDIQLAQLKMLVRIAHDLRSGDKGAPVLPMHSYEHWSKLLDEIGKMIGGLQKTFGR